MLGNLNVSMSLLSRVEFKIHTSQHTRCISSSICVALFCSRLDVFKPAFWTTWARVSPKRFSRWILRILRASITSSRFMSRINCRVFVDIPKMISARSLVISKGRPQASKSFNKGPILTLERTRMIGYFRGKKSLLVSRTYLAPKRRASFFRIRHMIKRTNLRTIQSPLNSLERLREIAATRKCHLAQGMIRESVESWQGRIHFVFQWAWQPWEVERKWVWRLDGQNHSD